MGDISARDLLLPPCIMSLLRLPLAVVFVTCAREPQIAFLVMLAAGLSDILDGWLARRFDMATPTGALIDPIADKLFIATVLVTLVLHGKVSLAEALLLSTRELGELPLVLWIAVKRRVRPEPAVMPRANVVGKVATILQFGTVAVAVFGVSGFSMMVYVTALGGTVAALSYWLRTLRNAGTRSTMIA
ncbi:MAG: CDP-alcohol phosphatidyltransferase family protein [Myxococcales bacterium]|nr:CDP-alcohol phosphatidyltransferase family protein [Myxococcales bacterium]